MLGSSPRRARTSGLQDKTQSAQGGEVQPRRANLDHAAESDEGAGSKLLGTGGVVQLWDLGPAAIESAAKVGGWVELGLACEAKARSCVRCASNLFACSADVPCCSGPIYQQQRISTFTVQKGGHHAPIQSHLSGSPRKAAAPRPLGPKLPASFFFPSFLGREEVSKKVPLKTGFKPCRWSKKDIRQPREEQRQLLLVWCGVAGCLCNRLNPPST